MQVNNDWLAPCGLYCGVCGILIAHRENNQKFKERLAAVYNLRPEQIRCDGCLSNDVFEYCTVCPIKACAAAKGYDGCRQCGDFPCEAINNFAMPVGKKVILRAVPYWREHGTEKWVEHEEARYHCPSCGNKLFRGAKRCNQCKEPVDVDG